MPPTEREILEAHFILAKADQKGKKKIPKATKARPGKENMLELPIGGTVKKEATCHYQVCFSCIFYVLQLNLSLSR